MQKKQNLLGLRREGVADAGEEGGRGLEMRTVLAEIVGERSGNETTTQMLGIEERHYVIVRRMEDINRCAGLPRGANRVCAQQSIFQIIPQIIFRRKLLIIIFRIISIIFLSTTL